MERIRRSEFQFTLGGEGRGGGGTGLRGLSRVDNNNVFRFERNRNAMRYFFFFFFTKIFIRN